MNTAERIATLRADAALRGVDVDALSDVELLLREYDQASKDAYDRGHRIQALLTEQSRRDRTVYAAARRSAQDDRIAWATHYRLILAERAEAPINGLVYRIGHLPDRLGPKAMAEFKQAAEQAAGEIQWARKQRALHPEIVLISKWRTEVERLRDYVTDRARTIHKAMSLTDIDCICVGCSLLLGMDDVPLADEPGEGKTS